MFKKSILTLSIIATLLFQGCSEDKTKKEVNTMISTSEYVLTDLNNKQHVVKKVDKGFILAGAEDKIVIFDIFATWCPPCRGAAQHLSSLQEKYKNDLIIIGITIEDNIQNEKLAEFAKTYNANYILVNSDQNRRLNSAIVKELELGDRYPIPTLAMYKNAKLINHYIGATEEEFIDSDIRITLGK
ncbi:putative lipoprotein thiredoxin [Sulfurimonas denitrificans DSM 1251]|uniref:Putative lipoprotein thiredoxin n=1 Tax=Sulfurimonas denitrificans (strain ATCC 33889 / DSM 1251) TaxID=326298 RepID=Q30SA9_SULDN|nr:TlpA disulfide reductase family protein [Sulfurimonas denitrificans]ABB44122.1 putative lipoprotein thiredoxin [Sulfurimonas denitrificans DSM 1251]MDD3441869.1 TlpA disulfide reductase family protein [Sulfurimonas denitrificans]